MKNKSVILKAIATHLIAITIGVLLVVLTPVIKPIFRISPYIIDLSFNNGGNRVTFELNTDEKNSIDVSGEIVDCDKVHYEGNYKYLIVGIKRYDAIANGGIILYNTNGDSVDSFIFPQKNPLEVPGLREIFHRTYQDKQGKDVWIYDQYEIHFIPPSNEPPADNWELVSMMIEDVYEDNDSQEVIAIFFGYEPSKSYFSALVIFSISKGKLQIRNHFWHPGTFIIRGLLDINEDNMPEIICTGYCNAGEFYGKYLNDFKSYGWFPCVFALRFNPLIDKIARLEFFHRSYEPIVWYNLIPPEKDKKIDIQNLTFSDNKVTIMMGSRHYDVNTSTGEQIRKFPTTSPDIYCVMH